MPESDRSSMTKSDDAISLPELLQSLRADLAQAAHEGELQRASLAQKYSATIHEFTVEKIVLELVVEIQRTEASEYGARLYILNAKADESHRSTMRQKIALTLTAKGLQLGDDENADSSIRHDASLEE